MPKRNLTDRAIKALKPAKAGERYDIGDAVVPGLLVRVTDKGTKTFALVGRFPGSPNPTRRALGEYGQLTLEAARKEARRWHELIHQGKDPREEIERKKLAEARRRKDTFASVCEDYFADIKRLGHRRGAETEREIRREFVSRWGTRPITDITRPDLVAVIDAALKRGAPWQAHHIFSYASRLFNWAIERGWLEHSPAHGMRPARIIGEKKGRTRILTDAEIKALWQVSADLGYPYAPLVRMLMLTGQRKSEVAEARWSEFDLDNKREWTIPAERMKMDTAHMVPLTDDAIVVLQSLRRFNGGEYLFSTTYGKSPVNGFSKAKVRLDRLMPPDTPPWVFHDIRRTMRTHLSALPVPDLVRELVIAHAKPGLHKVYDQHAYAAEKRHALELWAARLRSIVEPPPANVISLDMARA